MKLSTAFNAQRRRAAQRAIEWEFTFDEWLSVWVSSGRLEQRGKGKGKYVMARLGDVGPYAQHNVEIVLYEKNASDARANNPVSSEQLRINAIGKGRGWTFVRNGYQVVVAHRYIGRFKTEAEAVAARASAVEAKLRGDGSQ